MRAAMLWGLAAGVVTMPEVVDATTPRHEKSSNRFGEVAMQRQI